MTKKALPLKTPEYFVFIIYNNEKNHKLYIESKHKTFLFGGPEKNNIKIKETKR